MCPFTLSGDVKRYDTADEDNYSQVNIFWNKVSSSKLKEMSPVDIEFVLNLRGKGTLKTLRQC